MIQHTIAALNKIPGTTLARNFASNHPVLFNACKGLIASVAAGYAVYGVLITGRKLLPESKRYELLPAQKVEEIAICTICALACLTLLKTAATMAK